MRYDYAKPTDPDEEASKPVLYDQWTQYVVASELRNAVRLARSVHILILSVHVLVLSVHVLTLSVQVRLARSAAAVTASPLVSVLRSMVGSGAEAEGFMS